MDWPTLLTCGSIRGSGHDESLAALFQVRCSGDRIDHACDFLGTATLAAQLVAWGLGVGAETVTSSTVWRLLHWPTPLGSDELGRDLLVRLLAGGQVLLAIGVVTALVAAVIGTAIGLVTGSLGEYTDALLMRITDGIIALPLLPLLIIMAALAHPGYGRCRIPSWSSCGW